MDETSERSRAPSIADGSWLEAVCERLAARQDWRGLVRLVEHWDAAEAPGWGRPTLPARLLLARSFIELQLMDRAWVRLKEIGEEAPDDLEGIELTARMYVERGWPVRARRLLQRGMALQPSNRALQQLMRQSHAPPLQPASNAREIEREGEPAEQLQLAERFMASGSFLRARSILERLRRGRGPEQGRAELLLWGMRGDFVEQDGDPGAVALELVPELTPGTLDEAEGLDDSLDHSSEVTSAGPGASGAADADDEDSFPALFRRVESPVVQEPLSDEVTAVSRLASPGELLHRQETEEEFDGQINPETGSSDTQVRMVIRTDGSSSDGPGHLRREDESYKLRETLNLREYLGSVGMDHAFDDVSEEVDLEEEDEDLVVVTRREQPAAAESAEEAAFDGPIEVVERGGTEVEEVVKPLRPLQDEDDTTIAEQAPASPRPTSGPAIPPAVFAAAAAFVVFAVLVGAFAVVLALILR